MTRKRSKLEIYLDVLRAVKTGTTKPTNVMYKCNLAWKPFKRILRALTESSLIRPVEKGSRKVYELTKKGEEILVYFEEAEALFATLRERRNSRNRRS